MIEIQLSDRDATLFFIAVFLLVIGGLPSALALVIIYLTAINLDDVPEGETPCFSFNSKKVKRKTK